MLKSLKKRLADYVQEHWKKKLRNLNDERLYELFAETDRINIEPQIYAGNLLFERNYDSDKLVEARQNLIKSIEESFVNQYPQNLKSIMIEDLIRTLLVFIIFPLFWFLIIHYPIFELYSSPNFILNLFLLAGYWFFIGRFVAIKNAAWSYQKAYKKKNALIKRIMSELNF